MLNFLTEIEDWSEGCDRCVTVKNGCNDASFLLIMVSEVSVGGRLETHVWTECHDTENDGQRSSFSPWKNGTRH